MQVIHGLNRIPILRCSPRLFYSSKAAANYENFKKLRAYPFRVTPEAAQKMMARLAGPLCDNRGILASLWATVSPSSNFLRPKRFSAAYFPAWIVSAEIEADITYEDARRRGTAIFNNCYVPGSHVPTLSAAALWGDNLNSEEPFPCVIQLGDHIPSENETQVFDPSLLRQHGEEVQCIPFTTSPFSLLDIARNLSWSNAVVNENLKFAPSSLKVNLFSARPVLLPLYIAIYEIETNDVPPGSTLTMWTLAHAEWSNTMTDNFAVKFHNKRKANMVFKLFGFLSDASPDSEVLSYLPPDDQVKVHMIAFPGAKKASASIKLWLQKALGTSTNISMLAGTIENDDDPRIRPMTRAEKKALGQYFDNEREILMIKRIIEDVKSAGPDVKVITIQGPASPERATATFQTRLDSLLAKKEELKPRWWTEWESMQSQESADP